MHSQYICLSSRAACICTSVMVHSCMFPQPTCATLISGFDAHMARTMHYVSQCVVHKQEPYFDNNVRPVTVHQVQDNPYNKTFIAQIDQVGCQVCRTFRAACNTAVLCSTVPVQSQNKRSLDCVQVPHPTRLPGLCFVLLRKLHRMGVPSRLPLSSEH